MFIEHIVSVYIEKTNGKKWSSNFKRYIDMYSIDKIY